MLKGNVVENYEAVGYTELGWNSGSIPPWGGCSSILCSTVDQDLVDQSFSLALERKKSRREYITYRSALLKVS